MTAEPIGVIGVGYVGLVTAACFAARGPQVICRDIDQDKVALLKRGVVPIHEPGLTELVTANLERLASRPTWTCCSSARRSPSSASTRRRRSPATPTSRACRR